MMWNHDMDAAPEDIPILVWAAARSDWNPTNPCDIWVVCKIGDEDGADYYVEHDNDGMYMSWMKDTTPIKWMYLPK